MTFDWTPERTAKLKDLWDRGVSAREIKEHLGDENLTRNAVIGKANRMGLKSHGRANTPVSIIHFEIPSERQCHWPSGHPNDNEFSFCLLPTKEGKPYCDRHCRKAYRSASD